MNNPIKQISQTYKQSLILGFVLLLSGAALFFFSSQVGQESYAWSNWVSGKVARQWNQYFALGLTPAEVDRLTYMLYAPVRKLAHMFEYGVSAFVIYSFLVIFEKERQKPVWKLRLSVLIIFTLGCLDETHQFFVPGRGSHIADVGWDLLGALVGIGVWIICNDLYLRGKREWNKRKK